MHQADDVFADRPELFRNYSGDKFPGTGSILTLVNDAL